MIKSVNFNEEQRELIQFILHVQMGSIGRCLGESIPPDLYMLLDDASATWVDYEKALLELETKVTNICNDPSLLFTLDKEEMSLFRHILANLDDETKEKYPDAISNLWHKIFTTEEFDSTLTLN